MDDIPQEVLYDAYSDGQAMTTWDFLRLVAQHHTDRADRLRALRKKSWQSQSRELDGVADHIRAYADQLEQFAANNPTERPAPAPEPHPDAVPGLPGNTGRCASFRRADGDDQTVCTLDRGHDGDHIGVISDGDEVTWPRTPSGHVCGDVVILPDGTALNCARPLGHDGDEHHDGRYQFWPRGIGTSRYVRTCERCNMDTHGCPGCGEPVGHFEVACDGCNNDPAGSAVVLAETAPEVKPGTVPPCADLQPDIATALGTSCMLPKGHTGKHIGYTGARWDQVAKAETLGEIAEQQRATMVIPEQRAESDPVPVPAAVLVAEMKEEVSATVAELTGDEPIGTTVNVGGIEFVKHSNNPFHDGTGQVDFAPPLSNPFAPPNPSPVSATVTLGNPFQLTPAPPVEPPAAFLPPHLVPGEPKAHQSHSSITTMEKCGLQYRLKYRDGIGDDTPAWWNVAGTAFHAIVQAIEAAHAETVAAQLVGGPWDIDAPLVNQERVAASMWKAEFAELVERTERESGKARGTWKAAKGGKEGEAFWREYGGDLARMYVGHRRKFLAEPEGWRLLNKPNGEGWAHEVEFNATVDGVLLNGFIDSVWISADGMTILIEDFKSGSSEGDPFQPKLYGAALRALGPTGGRRIVTRFYEARKGAHSATMELTTADDAEVSYRANTAQTMDRAGIFPPNPSGYNCSTCPVKSRCPIMATKG